MKPTELLTKVKENLILTHTKDDALLLRLIAAAINYAESYQHKPDRYYTRRGSNMSAATEQAVTMLSSHFYESRDGSTAGFFGDNISAAQPDWRERR